MHLKTNLRIARADARQAQDVLDRVDEASRRAFLSAPLEREVELDYGDDESIDFVVYQAGIELLQKVTLLVTEDQVMKLVESSLRAEAEYLRKRLVLNGLAHGNMRVSVEFVNDE